VISADVPSGSTSQSLADSDATRVLVRTRNSTVAWPRSSSGDATGQSYVSDQASSPRWSVGCPHGKCPANEIHAAMPASGRTGSTSSPVS
jgi:hypothetical protein